MRDLNICRVRQEEARFDQTCEQAQELREAQRDEAVDRIMDQISQGNLDEDMASHFSPAMLMRVARIFSTYYRITRDGKTADLERAYSVTADDRMHIASGILDYAKDIAEMNL